MYPLVSVLVVSYNVRDYLLQAIDSIKKSTYDGPIEIIIIDNDSFDGTHLSLLKKHSDVTFIRNKKNLGFGKATNQAARKAKGDYLFVLNPDTIIEENTIQKLVDYLISKPQVGMVGPKILNSNGTLQLSSKRSIPSVAVSFPKMMGFSKLFPKNKWAGKYNLTYLDENKTHSVDAISGSAMMVKEKIFTQLGGFDERFFMYGEDLDICKRIGQLGYEIHYFPKTKIIHYGGESVRTAKFKSINAFFSSMSLFYKKHFSTSTSRILSLFIKVGICLKRFSAFLIEWKSQIISLLIDGITVGLSILIINYFYHSPIETVQSFNGLIYTIYLLIWIFSGYLFHLYGKNILSYHHACYSGLTGFILTSAFNGILYSFEAPNICATIGFTIVMILMPGWRLITHYLYLKIYGKRIFIKHNLLFTHRTLILGTPTNSNAVISKIRCKIDSGIDIIGICTKKLFSDNKNLSVPILGSVKRLSEIISSYRIKEIIFLSNSFSNQEILFLIDKTKQLNVIYRIVPRETDLLIGKASVEHFGDLSLVSVDIPYNKLINRFIKRIFDLLFSALGLILFSPLFFVMLFKGRRFCKINFWSKDSKILTGYIFVHSSKKIIQYLPLLWTVMKGKMSFVGGALVQTNQPNPNLSNKPGLTGIYRLKKIKPDDKFYKQAEYYYMQNQGFLLDLELLIMTFFILKQ